MFSTNQLLKRASTYLKLSVRCSYSTLLKSKKPAFRLPLTQKFNLAARSLTHTSNANFGGFPKHTLILLPALSPTMTEGRIAAWHIKVGQKISEGDNVFDVQTDKDSVPNVYQEEGGYVAKILVQEGEMVPTNAPVVVVVKKEADIAAFANFTAASESQAPPAAAEKPQPAAQSKPQPAAQPAPTAAKPAASTSAYPKYNAVLLPALSPTMTEGRVAAFHVKVGDKINEGDDIFDVQTDKDSVPNIYQESPGFIAQILIKEGDVVQTNSPVLIVVSKKEDIPKFASFTLSDVGSSGPAHSASSESPAPQTVQATSSQASTSAPASSSTERQAASPYAKKLASEQGVEINKLQGSGPNGRVISKDVLNAAKPAPAPAASAPKTAPPKAQSPPPKAPLAGGPEEEEYQRIALTPMRRVIAERLVLSKSTVPHFYLTVNIQMDQALHLRKTLNESSAVKISVNDFIVKAAALSLRDMPAVNSQWHGDHIRQFKHADVSVAVSTKTGLLTPIVFNAEQLGLGQIAAKTKELAEKARTSKLLPTEYQGGTCTISNLGMFGIDSFSAIINPPQGTILAVSGTNEVVVPDHAKDAKSPYKVIQVMSVTLSCDHRVVDGALGAQWLQKLKGYLEKPQTMLL